MEAIQIAIYCFVVVVVDVVDTSMNKLNNHIIDNICLYPNFQTNTDWSEYFAVKSLRIVGCRLHNVPVNREKHKQWGTPYYFLLLIRI